MATKKSLKPKNYHPKLDFSFMPLYKEQREIKESTARFKVVSFGRQSGKSFLAKEESLDHAINLGKLCWWVAPTYGAAAGHWRDLIRLLQKIEFPIKYINQSEMYIEFYGGGSINIKSADRPDNLRGPSLDFLVVDEAAFMLDTIWFKILQPMLTATRGSALICSTPNGMNYFYDLFKLGQNPKIDAYQSWTMPSTGSPYQDKATLELIRQTTHPLVWREEYLAEFIADGGGVFTGIDKATVVAAYLRPDPDLWYVMGIDWGSDDDFTVITFIDAVNRRQVYAERFTSYDPMETIDRVIQLMEIWRPRHSHIEKNGIGEPLWKLLRSRLLDGDNEQFDEDGTVSYGGHKIKAVHLDNPIKRDLIETLALELSTGRLQLLARDQEEAALATVAEAQISELSTFMRKRTNSGLQVTYEAPEGLKDDTVIALAYAVRGLPKIPKFVPFWETAKHPNVAARKDKKNPFRSKNKKAYNKRKPRTYNERGRGNAKRN